MNTAHTPFAHILGHLVDALGWEPLQRKRLEDDMGVKKHNGNTMSDTVKFEHDPNRKQTWDI